MNESSFSWVFKVPCIVSVVLNLVFLARIVHVLVSKLSVTASGAAAGGGAGGGGGGPGADHAAAVKTARAIGVLVPLFGLHNLLAAFKPDDGNSSLRITIEITSAITTSFQVP